MGELVRTVWIDGWEGGLFGWVGVWMDGQTVWMDGWMDGLFGWLVWADWIDG